MRGQFIYIWMIDITVVYSIGSLICCYAIIRYEGKILRQGGLGESSMWHTAGQVGTFVKTTNIFAVLYLGMGHRSFDHLELGFFCDMS